MLSSICTECPRSVFEKHFFFINLIYSKASTSAGHPVNKQWGTMYGCAEGGGLDFAPDKGWNKRLATHVCFRGWRLFYQHQNIRVYAAGSLSYSTRTIYSYDLYRYKLILYNSMCVCVFLLWNTKTSCVYIRRVWSILLYALSSSAPSQRFLGAHDTASGFQASARI